MYKLYFIQVFIKLLLINIYNGIVIHNYIKKNNKILNNYLLYLLYL